MKIIKVAWHALTLYLTCVVIIVEEILLRRLPQSGRVVSERRLLMIITLVSRSSHTIDERVTLGTKVAITRSTPIRTVY